MRARPFQSNVEESADEVPKLNADTRQLNTHDIACPVGSSQDPGWGRLRSVLGLVAPPQSHSVLLA